jgi:hypothetical protein
VKPSLFDPDLDAQLASTLAPEDEDDVQLVGSLPTTEFTRSRNGVNGFSVVPLWVTKEIAQARAYHAGPLVNVILQRMRVRRTTTVLITSAVWAEAASPSKYERETILNHLRLVPSVLKLEKRHKGYTRYQAVLGDMWSKTTEP